MDSIIVIAILSGGMAVTGIIALYLLQTDLKDRRKEDD